MTQEHEQPEQYTQLKKLVQDVFETGIGSSVILNGRRGAGKQKILDKVLHDLRRKRHEFQVIDLNGKIELDDVSALRAMAKQMEFQEAKKVSFQELLESMVTKSAVPLVVVLKSFERFTEHPRQALLYNLFDLTHKKAAIMIIGITTCMDAANKLEKRVRSRFSHRQIFFNTRITFEEYKKQVRNQALLAVEDQRSLQKCAKESFQDEVFNNALKAQYAFSRSIPKAVQLIQWTTPILTLADRPNLFEYTIQSLSTMGLSMLACASRLASRGDGAFTFEETYHEYNDFVVRESSSTFVINQTREIMWKAFDSLIVAQLLYSVQHTKISKEYLKMRLHVTDHEVRKAIMSSEEVPKSIQRWLRNE